MRIIKYFIWLYRTRKFFYLSDPFADPYVMRLESSILSDANTIRTKTSELEELKHEYSKLFGVIPYYHTRLKDKVIESRITVLEDLRKSISSNSIRLYDHMLDYYSREDYITLIRNRKSKRGLDLERNCP